MSTDVVLDDGSDGSWVTIRGSAVNARASDLMLDSPQRRSSSGGPFRRALVHDEQDGLTINFAGDYPGGVTIRGGNLNLRVHTQDGGTPKLPKKGRAGDLLLLKNVSYESTPTGRIPIGETCSLWLCIGEGGTQRFGTGGAFWQRVQLDRAVRGTE